MEGKKETKNGVKGYYYSPLFALQDKYVHSWTSWDGAFGGAVEAVLATVDHNFLSSYISRLVSPLGKPLQDMLVSFPGFLWMYPHADVSLTFLPPPQLPLLFFH